MKKTGLKLISGIIISVVIMGLMFYLFLFLNPLRIYESNTLKWTPILITIISFYVSGYINRNTPLRFLPLLFLPIIIFKLFNFAYFPFILILLLVGILSLIASRNHQNIKYASINWAGMVGIFLFFLLSQPLILQQDGFEYDDNGNLVNATTVWDFNNEDNPSLPNHILFDKNNNEVNISKIPKTTHLITFWATWCAPCLKEKPELNKLKEQFKDRDDIKFIDISFDTDKNKWMKYLEKKKPLGLQLISEDQQRTSREFHFAGIPMHMIVNADGTYKRYHSFEVVRKVITKTIR